MEDIEKVVFCVCMCVCRDLQRFIMDEAVPFVGKDEF